MNSKIIIGILIILALVAGFFVYQRPVSDGEVIKIGFIAPLTGPFPDWGESLQRGMFLALEDTKNEFDVDFQDSACDSRKIVDIARKFINVGGIKLIVGPGCLTGLKAALPIVIQENAIMFSTGLLDDAIFEEFDSSFLNWATQISTEGEFLAAYLGEQNSFENVAILHSATAFGQEFGNTLPAFFAEQGLEIPLIEEALQETTELRTIATKIISTNADAVFVHQAEKNLGAFAKQLREQGSLMQILSPYTTESESVLNASGDAIEGIIYTYPVNSADGTQEKEEFDRRYKGRFGKDAIPTASAYFVYDGMMILDQAVTKCGGQDADCVARFFKNVGNYSGIGGEISFGEDGRAIRPFGIKTIKDGEFVWITKEIELK